MQKIIILLIGVLFGITLTKGEVISWYRIYEMFRFESFHMFGIIGSAVVIGVLIKILSKKGVLKTMYKNNFEERIYKKGWKKYLFGGIIFGLGWAFAGSCPGPIYMLIGAGYPQIVILLVSAILGAFVQGLVAHKLPK